MAGEIRVPNLGESVTEATIARWLKHPGDRVEIDDPVVELETDKVTLEVGAPAAGTLADRLAEEGATVPVGAVLAHVADGASAAAVARSAANPLPNLPPLAGEGVPAAAERSADRLRRAGPAVRKLVAESGLDVTSLTPSGPRTSSLTFSSRCTCFPPTGPTSS